jgi:hypothetical protein
MFPLLAVHRSNFRLDKWESRKIGQRADRQTDRQTTHDIWSCVPENSDLFNAVVDCRINVFFLFVFCAPFRDDAKRRF